MGVAREAVEAGMDGIVSNHECQLDGVIGSLEVLPEIVDAVGNDITVLFDSGVRTNVDVIKALCLGAKGVYRTAVGLWAGNRGECGCEGGVVGDISGSGSKYGFSRD